MKNMQLVDEEEPQPQPHQRWKRLCFSRELGAGAGIKKLRRKSKEPAKLPLLDGARAFPADFKVREHVLAGMVGGPAAPRLEVPAGALFDGTPAPAGSAECPDGGGGCGGEAVDLRKHVFPAGLLAAASHPQPSRKDTCLRSVVLNGAESQAFPDANLPPRRMACQPPPPPDQHQHQHHHRAMESAYASVPHVIYRSGHPESSLSPRKRPGEAAGGGVSTEIKAIQQTRRLLANARERTRVHTISAAFEALRKQVPCYSYGQKLSKLAILRIACNYILSLAKLADLDYSADHSNVSFSECVEQCTRTLQAEGRSKKRKE